MPELYTGFAKQYEQGVQDDIYDAHLGRPARYID